MLHFFYNTIISSDIPVVVDPAKKTNLDYVAHVQIKTSKKCREYARAIIAAEPDISNANMCIKLREAKEKSFLDLLQETTNRMCNKNYLPITGLGRCPLKKCLSTSDILASANHDIDLPELPSISSIIQNAQEAAEEAYYSLGSFDDHQNTLYKLESENTNHHHQPGKLGSAYLNGIAGGNVGNTTSKGSFSPFGVLLSPLLDPPPLGNDAAARSSGTDSTLDQNAGGYVIIDMQPDEAPSALRPVAWHQKLVILDNLINKQIQNEIKSLSETYATSPRQVVMASVLLSARADDETLTRQQQLLSSGKKDAAALSAAFAVQRERIENAAAACVDGIFEEAESIVNMHEQRKQKGISSTCSSPSGRVQTGFNFLSTTTPRRSRAREISTEIDKVVENISAEHEQTMKELEDTTKNTMAEVRKKDDFLIEVYSQRANKIDPLAGEPHGQTTNELKFHIDVVSDSAMSVNENVTGHSNVRNLSSSGFKPSVETPNRLARRKVENLTSEQIRKMGIDLRAGKNNLHSVASLPCDSSLLKTAKARELLTKELKEGLGIAGKSSRSFETRIVCGGAPLPSSSFNDQGPDLSPVGFDPRRTQEGFRVMSSAALEAIEGNSKLFEVVDFPHEKSNHNHDSSKSSFFNEGFSSNFGVTGATNQFSSSSTAFMTGRKSAKLLKSPSSLAVTDFEAPHSKTYVRPIYSDGSQLIQNDDVSVHLKHKDSPNKSFPMKHSALSEALNAVIPIELFAPPNGVSTSKLTPGLGPVLSTKSQELYANNMQNTNSSWSSMSSFNEDKTFEPTGERLRNFAVNKKKFVDQLPYNAVERAVDRLCNPRRHKATPSCSHGRSFNFFEVAPASAMARTLNLPVFENREQLTRADSPPSRMLSTLKDHLTSSLPHLKKKNSGKLINKKHASQILDTFGDPQLETSTSESCIPIHSHPKQSILEIGTSDRRGLHINPKWKQPVRKLKTEPWAKNPPRLILAGGILPLNPPTELQPATRIKSVIRCEPRIVDGRSMAAHLDILHSAKPHLFPLVSTEDISSIDRINDARTLLATNKSTSLKVLQNSLTHLLHPLGSEH